jgi:SAM-dependent methyltransferase
VLDICDLHALADGAFDLVLALGGPLTLCRDARLAVGEMRRVLKPGGYAVCDVANRYRTALELVEDGNLGQLAGLLDTGRFSRPDGLTDHRFGPQELSNLFRASGLEVLHVAGICPFFDFLPSREQVRILEDDRTCAILDDVSQRYAQHPVVMGLSGRLLVVAQNRA